MLVPLFALHFQKPKFQFPSFILSFFCQGYKNNHKMAAIPQGGTWIDTLQKSFVDVPIDEANDNGIATTEFLEASEALTTLFGMVKHARNKARYRLTQVLF